MRVLLFAIVLGFMPGSVWAQATASPPQPAAPVAGPAAPPAAKPPASQPPATETPDTDTEAAPGAGMCEGKSATECGVSPQDFKKGLAAYKNSQNLKKQELFEPALKAVNEAVGLVPRDAEFLTERELLRQQLAFEHIERGNDLMLQNRTMEAAAEFRQALEMDGSNQFAWDRLREIANIAAPPAPSYIVNRADDESSVLQPSPGLQSLKINGNTRDAFTQVGKAFGIKVTFDDSTPSRNVKLDLDRVTFAQAMDAIALVTRCFWSARDWGEVMVATDTNKNHKEFDQYVLRTYYLPDIDTPQEMNDIVNVLRILFELRFVQSAPNNQSITVRGPAPVVEAATRFLESLWSGKPQVMIDLEVFAVNHQMMRNMGVSLPLQFSAFNIPEAALAALSNTNIQQLISQLITSGGLNSANAASSIAALIAQIQQQQNSLFQNPVATFGGGKTLTGVGIPPTTINFSYTDSRVTSLEKLSLHAAQGNAATFRVGTRYPVMNASYSNAVNIPSQIASLLGPTGAGLGQSNALLAYPSFSYEDLGITLKAKPSIHGENDVTLDLELQMRALAGGSVNGVPILSNQSYKGVVTVMSGESAVIAGEITQSEMQALQGIPGIHNLPVLGTLTSNRTKQTDDEELLLVITPHIMSVGPERNGPSIPVPTAQ